MQINQIAFFRGCILFFITATTTSCSWLGAAAQAQNKAVNSSAIDLKIKELAEDPALIPLRVVSSKRIYSDSAGTVINIQPVIQSTHADGVIGALDSLLVFSGTNLLSSLDYSYQVRVPPQATISREKLATIATTFAQRHFAEFWQAVGEANLQENTLASDKTEFTWTRLHQGLTVASLSLIVRIWDGKIVGINYYFPSDMSPLKATKINPEYARNKIIERAENTNKGKIKNVRVSNLTLRQFGKPAKLSYVARLTATKVQDGSLLRAVDVLDANDGSFFAPYIAFSSAHRNDGVKFTTNDYSPVWLNGLLFFVSQNTLKGMPNWAKFPPQINLLNSRGNHKYLTCDLSRYPNTLNSSASGAWITVVRNDWTYAFNLETGIHRILGMPKRPGETPTIDSDGKWAVVSGTGRDRNSDLDLLPDDLTARGERLGIRGRLVSKGDDHHPLFSPDNKWLYFVTTTAQKDKTTPQGEKIVSALRRIPAELSHTRGLKTLKLEQIQTIIPNIPSDVSRLSIYSNGQKLLLQTEKGMFNLSVAEKKATPIVPKNLKDVEVNAPITQTRDGWAGPSDNEVTFSGKTTDKAGKVRWRIYSCRFDGTGLKAWTPKENQSVEAYKFPKAPDGKTAIDLAKQWALKEIEWEDYLKRQ
jgi:hypothetical protein